MTMRLVDQALLLETSIKKLRKIHVYRCIAIEELVGCGVHQQFLPPCQTIVL